MPTTIEALILIALVISPGYICARFARDVIVMSRDDGDIRFLLPSLACGTLVHILMAWWSERILQYYRGGTLDSHLLEFTGWGIGTGFVAPVVIGVAISQIAKLDWVDRQLDKIGMGYVDRLPTAWEYSLRFNRASYVRVYLKDQEAPLGGVFGNRSFAASDPRRMDLYVERLMLLDDDGSFTGEALPSTWGAWFSPDVISHVEFFEGADTRSREEASRDE